MNPMLISLYWKKHAFPREQSQHEGYKTLLTSFNSERSAVACLDFRSSCRRESESLL